MIQKLKKIDYISFSVILLITTILCSAFIQMHYSSDTYVLFDLGYMKYPSKYFLLDGRLISTLVCYAGGLLHLPYNIYIISLDIIGIFCISMSIYILYKSILNISKFNSNLTKLLLLLSCFTLILNQFSLEYLVFPESGVMCLGQLLCVIAATKFISEEKNKYLKIILLIFISVFCYQGLLNIFPILSIVLIFLKQISNKEISLKNNFKSSSKELIIIVLISIFALIINIISIKIGTSLLNDSSNRTIKITNLESFKIRLNTILNYMDQIWNCSLNMLPKHLNSVILALTLAALILLKVKKETIFKYLFTLFIILIVCIVPMFLLNTGPCGRVNAPIAQLWGISLIFLLLAINHSKNTNNYLKLFIYSLVVLSFLINSVMILRNSYEHIAANKVDENMGLTIKYLIDEYECKTGITVTKFSFVYDQKPQQYATGIKEIGSLTERKLACSWCINEAMDYYCERKFERVKMPVKIYGEKMPKKDYSFFCEEQVLFDNDTLYLYVY